MRRMRVPAARPGSWEDVLHHACGDDRLLIFEEADDRDVFLEERGHRAIGVVYQPRYGHLGNYVPTTLGKRYDAIVHIEESDALRPLQDLQPPREAEPPETYPWGL